jgi:hypothetical protein
MQVLNLSLFRGVNILNLYIYNFFKIICKFKGNIYSFLIIYNINI